MVQWGRTLIIGGIMITVLGLLLTFGAKLPFRLGRLPLDFRYESRNIGVYFPLGTSIVISIVLTIVIRFLTKR